MRQPGSGGKLPGLPYWKEVNIISPDSRQFSDFHYGKAQHAKAGAWYSVMNFLLSVVVKKTDFFDYHTFTLLRSYSLLQYFSPRTISRIVVRVLKLLKRTRTWKSLQYMPYIKPLKGGSPYGELFFCEKSVQSVFRQQFLRILLVECASEKYYNISVLLYKNGRNRISGCRCIQSA